MAATEELRILLRTIADTSGLTKTEQGLKGVQTVGQTSASSLLQFGAAAGIAAAATTRLASFLGDSIQASRDHERISRATAASYGAQTAAWTSFATQLSATTGFTSDAILEAALSARTLSTNYGLTIEQTQKLIRTSADLARIRGIGVAQSFERVQSAIRGEAEASEYLGLTLNDTFIKNNAQNGSLKNTYETMTDVQKAQVRYGELLRQTATFQGLATSSANSLDAAFMRTESSANKLQVTLGKTFAPATVEALKLAAQAMHDLAVYTEVAARAGPGVQSVFAGLGAVKESSQAQLAYERAQRERDLAALEGRRLLELNVLPGVADPRLVWELQQAERDRAAREGRRLLQLNENLPQRDTAAELARVAYLDQLEAATRDLTDAYREQNRIERESIQLSAELARAQLAALPATERLQDVQTRIQRDQLLLGMRGQLSPEQRQAARLDIRNLTRNVLPGAQLAALDAELGQRPVERALTRNRLLGTMGAGAAALAEGRVEHVVSGNIHITGDLATAVLSDDQKTQIGQEIVGMFHNARVAAENTASTRLAGA